MEETILLEMYLFINPIGSTCYHTEQNILDMIQEAREDVRFRFIPLMNMQSVQDIMEMNGKSRTDLATRNKLVMNIYHAALDFKASLFQGKKRGRNFLLSIQGQMEYSVDGNYTNDIAMQAALESGLDKEMFIHDRNSEFTGKSFMKDQKIAAEMNVKHHPTVVLFNVKGYDCGIAMDACKSNHVLEEILAGRMPTDLVEKDCGCHSQMNSFLKSNRTPLKIQIDSNN